MGEDVINPVLHFIVAKTESGKLIGFMSASVDEWELGVTAGQDAMSSKSEPNFILP